MKHTRGPWKVIHTQTRKLEWNIGTELGAPVPAIIMEGLNNRDGNAEANARLIAAAPDMLDALERFNMDHGHTMSEPRETCKYCQVRQALAKAKGEL